MRDAYIVTALRTPGCRRNKGALANTRPEALISFILDAVVKATPGLDKAMVEDIMLGCSFPEAEQGLNIGRIAAQIAGFPDSVSGATINRFCSSGLEAIVQSCMRVMVGFSEVTMAGGIESMSFVPMGGNLPRTFPEWTKEHPDLYVSMGITAENVAKRYNVSRQDQDEFAAGSHQKAASAQKEGRFIEVVPTPAVKFVAQADGTFKKEIFLQAKDDGVRADTTPESLAKLRPVFAAAGSVTAGNSSQTTDGAAASVIMALEKCKELGLTPLGKLKSYATVGVRADEMGVGPAYAIPKALAIAGLKVTDVGLYEINEAFASQALYSMRVLGLDKPGQKEKVNVNGGAIALGHPLGCTGSKLSATLLNNMKAKGVKYGVVSMCIGGGMGAAAVFELYEA